MTLQVSWHASDCPEPAIRSGLSELARQLGMEIKIRFTEPHRQQRFAVFVTKEPHCFEALMAECRAGKLKAVPALVISPCAPWRNTKSTSWSWRGS